MSQGPGWWQASDGRWYPPESHPNAAPTPPAPSPGPGPGPYPGPGAAPGAGYGPPPSPYGGYGPPPGYGPVPGYGPPPGYGMAPTYGYPGYAGRTPSGKPSVQGMSIASMVLGIVGLVFFCIPVLGFLCAIIGLPLGGVALSRISKGVADPNGRGQAIAGVTMTIIALALAVLLFTAQVHRGFYFS